ncbi:unnamed protein product [Lactuca virosa]|uniref:Uncharacterized protein n=1 Tax=Lactuca virosa TaxID=75947 RepID=A0AAU9NSQ5_9ASTR|nr:unnamed protein product [Lactuca virosa]
MFVTSDPKKFVIVGSILPPILSTVPADHPIIMEYLKTAVSTEVGGSEEEIPWKKVKSSKRKGKTIVSKQSKKHTREKPQVVIKEDSSEHTASLDRNETESALNNEVNSTLGRNQYLFQSQFKLILSLRFVETDLVFQVESDHEDDDAPMTKGYLRKLNKKLDEILSRYSTFINTKYEELLSSHPETTQNLVNEHADKLSQYQKLVDDYAKLVKEASS